MVTMGEGHTPLIPAKQMGADYGIRNLYFKLEITNPSGSYKDRFAAAAVSHLLDSGSRICLATSSGNTGSALAAYCARVGLPCFIVVVDGTPAAKLAQMQIYGAHTLMVRGFGLDEGITSQVFNELEKVSATFHTRVQISAFAFSPEGMAGVETVAMEIAEHIPGPYNHIFSPTGGGGLTLAVGKGFQKWKDHHPGFVLPRLHCVQPEGNDTIAGALRQGRGKATPISQSKTKVSGLQVPGILDGDKTLAICGRSGGEGFLVSDDLVFRLQSELALREGIYCEPAGAVALAGAIQAAEEGNISPEENVICLVTGHGFKDSAMHGRMESVRNEYFDHAESVTKYIAQVINKSYNNK